MAGAQPAPARLCAGRALLVSECGRSTRTLGAMRYVTCMVLLGLVAGCVTYKESSYLRPSGAGETLRDFGVPRIQQISVGTAASVRLFADREKSKTNLTLLINVTSGHAVRLSEGSVSFQCGFESPITVALPSGDEGRLKDGVGYVRSRNPSDNLQGTEYGRRVPKSGDVSTGDYRFDVTLPDCDIDAFRVFLPQLQVDGAPIDILPVTFHAERGRFLDFPPIA